MTSTAISAQGTTINIGGTSGSAKTVSGLALGNPTIVTATAHGFENGDVVGFASLAGNTSLNGKSYVVKNKTTNTFAVDEDTTGGPAWTSGGTATPVTFTKVGNTKGFSGFDGQASEQDVSNFDSTGKEYRLGLYDGGNVTIDLDLDDDDTGVQACFQAQKSSTLKNFKIVLPEGSTPNITFAAFVRKMTRSGAVDGVYRGQLTLRISGAVTVA